jgi:hypothetical protein
MSFGRSSGIITVSPAIAAGQQPSRSMLWSNISRRVMERQFKQYRDKNKGQKRNVLQDFLIGSMSKVNKAPLLTTSASDFPRYFPTIKLIKP